VQGAEPRGGLSARAGCRTAGSGLRPGGVNPASARVANSYFVVADGDGNILESTPEVRRQYYKGG